MNLEDKALQSRLMVIRFDPLENTVDSANLYNEWLMIRELLSSLAVDFENLLVDGKLDRYAMMDCASFLGAAVGTKRDRNTNSWGMLLYYMLNVNAMFQADGNEQLAIFEWMLTTVTRSAVEQNSTNILDQFVLAACKLRADGGTGSDGTVNQMTSFDRSIHFHNFRATHHSYTNVLCFRLDSCIHVIKTVLGKTFKLHELHDAIEASNVAYKSKAYFYDNSSNAWPIAANEFDQSRLEHVQRPLREDELQPDQLVQLNCLCYGKQHLTKLMKVIEEGGQLDVDYKKIEIVSAHPDVGKYNFFNATTAEGWFGYRVIDTCNFSKFAGAKNLLHVGSAQANAELVQEVVELNHAHGFGSVLSCYNPVSLLEFFSYGPFDLSIMPPCFLKVPFMARNAEGDEEMDDFWDLAHVGIRSPISHRSGSSTPNSTRRTLFTVPTAAVGGEINDRSNGSNGSLPTGGRPGSTPLKDISNERRGTLCEPTEERPTKRARHSRFIDDEADDEPLEVTAEQANQPPLNSNRKLPIAII